MAIFGNMSITNAGQNLYAKAQAGKPINFTRMQLGSGQIGTQNPATLVSLVNPQYYVPISSISNNTDQKTATISGIIDNSGITQATYICEIGLWAQDPDIGEILYGYASAGNTGDYMAPATQGPYSWSYQINAAIGNAANVTATLSSNTFDYGVVSSDTSLSIINGANQRAINKNVDNALLTLRNQSLRYVATTGSNNAYNVALSDVTALYNGLTINIVPNVDNTGAATLQANALAVVPIKFNGADLNAGDMKAGKLCTVIFDGTNYNLQVTADQFASQKAENMTFENNTNSSIDAINVKLSDYNSYASAIDSNGIYTVMDYKRADGTLYMKSTLSGGTSPNYTTDTWQFYNTAGDTVIATKVWTITYDVNGKITTKVVA